MAKRGGFPGGMPGNMNNLMKQAQRMQRQMEEQQAELENKEFSAIAATNEALRKCEEESQAQMAKITGGLGGLGGGLF